MQHHGVPVSFHGVQIKQAILMMESFRSLHLLRATEDSIQKKVGFIHREIMYRRQEILFALVQMNI